MPMENNKTRTATASATLHSEDKPTAAFLREALDNGRDVIENEGMYLDDRRWDDWLTLYTENCEYWVPAWKMDGTLGTSHDEELSHIYYANRAGLAERVSRLTSRWSPASSPVPRTCHIVANVRLIDDPTKDRIELRASWVTHALYVRQRQTYAFFGDAEYELAFVSGEWLIARKKVVLKNDYIPSMIDVNCL
jgi:3-phenylpropionate/cinnamic acid dioxygenase small subunit